MKLIIDIPKETYDIYKEYAHDIDINTTVGAIANGIPYEERPKGEWIHSLGCGIGKAVCSNCGQVGETKKFCGNCGAEMIGSDEND